MTKARVDEIVDQASRMGVAAVCGGSHSAMCSVGAVALRYADGAFMVVQSGGNTGSRKDAAEVWFTGDEKAVREYLAKPGPIVQCGPSSYRAWR